MTHENNGKIGVFLCDNVALYGSEKGQFANNIKAGDTAIVLEWDATDERDEICGKRVGYSGKINKSKMAKVLLASSEESGKICFVDHSELFVLKEKFTNKLTGKTFCITGTLEFAREVFIAILQSCGGRYAKQMSGKVDYLISARSDTVKAQEAKRLGTTVINEEEFYNKIIGCGSLRSQ